MKIAKADSDEFRDAAGIAMRARSSPEGLLARWVVVLVSAAIAAAVVSGMVQHFTYSQWSSVDLGVIICGGGLGLALLAAYEEGLPFIELAGGLALGPAVVFLVGRSGYVYYSADLWQIVDLAAVGCYVSVAVIVFPRPGPRRREVALPAAGGYWHMFTRAHTPVWKAADPREWHPDSFVFKAHAGDVVEVEGLEHYRRGFDSILSQGSGRAPVREFLAYLIPGPMGVGPEGGSIYVVLRSPRDDVGPGVVGWVPSGFLVPSYKPIVDRLAATSRLAECQATVERMNVGGAARKLAVQLQLGSPEACMAELDAEGAR